MDLARADLDLRRGPLYWHGKNIGIRMAIDEARGKKQQQNKAAAASFPHVSTRQLLAQFPPSVRNLDLRGVALTDAQLWEGACALADDDEKRRHTATKTTTTTTTTTVVEWCERLLAGGDDDDDASFPVARGKTLNLSSSSAWTVGPLLKKMRSLSLALGESLTAVDLSQTATSDEDVEAFAARTFELRVLRLAGCENISNLGIKAVVSCCHRTLTRLDLARCERLTAEACGWVAGSLGCARLGCRGLESLDISRCSKMTDDALRAVAAGCRRLRFLAVTGNARLSDAGVVAVARSCRRLEVLAVGECRGIGDRSVRAVGRWCGELRALLAPRAGPIRNSGLAALAAGCPRLATLDIAGAELVSEGALGTLATRCRALRTLNVTGCEQVTVRSLRSLIAGVGLVREATTFFGFAPIEDHASRALEARQRELEHRSARLICTLFRFYRWRRIAREIVWFIKQDKASLVLARCALRFSRRARANRDRAADRAAESARVLQRSWRAVKGRRFAHALARERDLRSSKLREIALFQALFRGYACRRADDVAAPAIERIRDVRRARRSIAAATRLAAVVRAVLARRHAKVYAQLRARLLEDADVAAHNAQRVVRERLAYREMTRRRLEKRRRDELEAWAARRIVGLFRVVACRNEATRLRRAAERLAAARDGAARVVQRCTRGLFGRQDARRRRAAGARRVRAAVDIQRAFRGSRILAWRHVRLNETAACVLNRQRFEVLRSAESATRRYQDFVAALDRDSCSSSSGDDEDDASPDSAWVERIDPASRATTWLNARTGEEVSENPLVDPVDAELVGCSVRVYWPSMDQWYEGTLAKFHRRRKRYRVEYHDGSGDYEWLDLEANADRVQLYDARGEWAMLDQAYRPQLELRRARRADLKNLARRAKELEDESKRWEKVDETRWFNSLTGLVKVVDEDAAPFWMESRDERGNFCFEHGETGERVYEDPRFRADDDSPEQKAAKAACLDQIRYGAYLAAALLFEWDSLLDDDDDDESGKKKVVRVEVSPKRRALLKRVAAAERTVRDTSAAVSRARELWTKGAFEDTPELVQASALLHRVLDLLAKAQLQADADQQHKRDLIANLAARPSRGKPIVCTKCSHEVPQSATHCIYCGERCTTWK